MHPYLEVVPMKLMSIYFRVITTSLLIISTSQATYAGTAIRANGDVKIINGGAIVFPDDTRQTTATMQGPQGPQGPPGIQGPEGPEGPQGPAGEVTITSICSAITSTGESTTFCSKSHDDVITGINLTLAAEKTIINTKGASTTVADLIPHYYVNGYLNMGMDVFQDIEDTLTQDMGTVSVFDVDSIVKYDYVNKHVIAVINMSTSNWGTGKLVMSFRYDESKSKWLHYGDNRIVDVSANIRSGQPTLKVYDNRGLLSSVYATGPGITNYKNIPKTSTYDFTAILDSTPTSLSEYVFTLKKMDGTILTYTVYFM